MITRLRTAGGEVGTGRSVPAPGIRIPNSNDPGLMRSLPTGTVEDSYSAHFHPRRTGSSSGGAAPVGGLQMGSDPDDAGFDGASGSAGAPGAFEHRPVAVAEVARLFAQVPTGTVIDATVGGGGHARAILAANEAVTLVGFDVDTEAVRASTRSLAEFGDRARVVRTRFDSLIQIVSQYALAPVSGVLFDLGVSSHQLDIAERGFSFRSGGPLDMRMDRHGAVTAADLLNTASEEEIATLVAANGEPVFARRIARSIIAARPLSTTTELAEVVRSAIPARARRAGRHPATRTFQAVRIAVNDELRVLRSGLAQALDTVQPGGRIVVLAYHSGEDRIVKEMFADAVRGGCHCPPGLPCVCGAVPRAAFVRGARAMRPSEVEVAENRRAASARLRAVEIPPRAG